MRTHISVSILSAAAVALLTGCTVKDVDQPAFAGPSTFATSITMKASPDTLLQDGASQSVITITAVDHEGRAKNIPLRADISIDGVIQDFGRLSTKQPVANGTPLVYTSPPTSSLSAGQVPQTVTIIVTPTDGVAFDGRGEFARQVDIRLVPQGIILPTNPNLVASFPAPPSPKVLDTLTFNASTSTNNGVACGTGCTYSWNFGDGTTGSGLVTTHQYRATGTYQATLTVTDARGAQSVSTQSVIVAAGTPPTVPPFTISPTPAPVNVDVFFDASASRAASGRNIISYNWNFGDGSSGTGVTTTHRYRGVGSYIITLTVTDDAQAGTQLSQNLSVGLASSQATALLTVTPSTGKPGQRVVLDASASTPSTGATIVSYRFDYGDGSPQETSGNPVQSHIYGTAGTFVASVEITDSNGKTSTRTATVTITP